MPDDENLPVDKQTEYYISELESYVKILRANKEYSNQRLDILTVTVCGAGIYTSFELMKFIGESLLLTAAQKSYLNIHFKTTGLLFTVAIIINFLSQWTAYKTSSLGIESTKMTILHAKGLNVDLDKVKNFDAKSDFFNRWTGRTNLLSMSFMISALICLIIFIWNLF